MKVCPAKTQIRLGICPVWSESSLCAQWVAKDPQLSSCGQRRLWSDWADAQADLSLRRAHMPHCWFCHVAAQFIYVDIQSACGQLLNQTVAGNIVVFMDMNTWTTRQMPKYYHDNKNNHLLQFYSVFYGHFISIKTCTELPVYKCWRSRI